MSDMRDAWMPIEAAPKDGSDFLATDGRRYEVLNQPPGCHMGVWMLIKGRWHGSVVTHTDPTHWRPLPKALTHNSAVTPQPTMDDAIDGAFKAAKSQFKHYRQVMKPPVPSSVQEIMELMMPYVRACVDAQTTPIDKVGYKPGEVTAAFAPLQAALTALVEKNHELQFSLDGVNAMRRPEWISVDERLPAPGIEPEQGEVK